MKCRETDCYWQRCGFGEFAASVWPKRSEMENSKVTMRSGFPANHIEDEATRRTSRSIHTGNKREDGTCMTGYS